MLYVTHYSGLRGGANLALLYTMLDMKRRYDIEPSLLAPGECEFTRRCRENDIEVFTAKYHMWQTGIRIRSRIKVAIKNVIKRFIFFPKIKSLVKDKGFNLIHTNSSVTNIGYDLAKYLEIPHVWHIREYGRDDYGLCYMFPDWYVRSRYADSERVITISRSLYDCYVNERRLCSPDNTRVIYNGLYVPDSYEKVYAHDERVNFCITGGVWETKNQLMAIRACAKLKAKTDGFMLHIIGDNINEYAEGLKRLVSSEGLNEHVKFWGFRSDVQELHRDMDVGLMLSRREAFGRVTVEYMMNYMPVIGVNTGATPEIVLDGETGYICPLNDSDRLAELMHRFITKPELMRTMGTKGRERAVKEFSLQRNTDEIYRLYQEVLSR